MSKKIKILVLVTALAVLGYYVLNLKKNRIGINAPISSKARFDYLSINDNEPLGLNYILPDAEKEAPPELIKFLVDNRYLNGYHSPEFTSFSCFKRNICSSEDNNFSSDVTDLNGDGGNEYLIIPWNVCGCSVRGASGNGDIFIVRGVGEKLEVVGELVGNGYTISKNKTNSYFDILTNFHSSAATGTETLYKFQIVTNGDTSSPSYQPFFTKWYDFSRTNKESED